MKISLSWLRQLLDLPTEIGWQDIVGRLNLSGLPVDGVTQVGAGLSGAVVAEIRGRRRHPKADKLTLVDVFDGESVTQVVCGAPNVPEPGEPGTSTRVVWARPGATLPSGLTLTPKEVRGIVSPGMLCAEDELGLSDEHAGILLLSPEDGLPIGSDFASAAGLPDVVLDLDVGANRPDCLGHVGVAREVAALFADAGARLKLPEYDLLPHTSASPATELATVEVRDAQGCPRYLARVITGVRIGKSPLSLRLLLQRLSVRALSNVVDATNLSLLLWGQPLHAFDLSRLAGRHIVVRRALPGEVMTTLDGTVRPLLPEDLLIADRDRGVAVAGVMGGQDSEVSGQTTDILLESAYFDPASIRRTARRLKLHTEASHRFERGTDPNDGVALASAGCALQIAQLCGGGVATGVIDVYPQPIAPRHIPLRPARTEAVLGVPVPREEQAERLRAIGLEVGDGMSGTLSVTVPTFRPDLSREIDLIEEVGRLRGYDRVEARLPALRLSQVGRQRPSLSGVIADRARDLCTALGLDEVQTFSFVAPERLKNLGFPADDPRSRPIVLHNPLREELSALRTQLIPGLLEALRHNLSRGQGEVRLFEVGEVFLPVAEGKEPDERTRVAGVLSGHRDYWLKPRGEDGLQFFDVKGIVEEMLGRLGEKVQVRAARPGEVPWLHPGIAGVVVEEGSGRVLGEVGEVHPDLRQRLAIEVRAFAFEVDLPGSLPPVPRFAPLPRFPEISRDLSFFVEAAIPAGDLVATLRESAEPLLQAVRVVEDYREPGKVPPGKKGLLLTLIYRCLARTLTDEEVQKAHEGVVGHLQRKVPVELR